MNEEIYQYRWFNVYYGKWDDWQFLRDLERIKYCISIGKKYQIRVLKQTHIEGYDPETDSIIPNKNITI